MAVRAADMFRKPTVDSVLSQFNRVVAKLAQVAEENERRSNELTVQINNLAHEQVVLDTESRRARTIAEKITNIFLD